MGRRGLYGCCFSMILSVTGVARAAALSDQVFVVWDFYNNAAWRAANRGDIPEATHRFKLAIETLQPEWERAPGLMARSYADFAWALYKQGRAEEARPLADWALEIRLRRFGPKSEPAAQSLYELAMIELDRSHVAEAEAFLRRSVEAWEAYAGPYDVRVSYYLTELARVLLIERKLDDAESIYRRILGFPERALPPRHVFRAVSFIGLARVYRLKGEPARAVFHEKQLVSLLPNLSHADAQEVATPLSDYLTQRRSAEATEEDALLLKVSKAVVTLAHADDTDQSKPFRRVFPASKTARAPSASNRTDPRSATP